LIAEKNFEGNTDSTSRVSSVGCDGATGFMPSVICSGLVASAAIGKSRNSVVTFHSPEAGNKYSSGRRSMITNRPTRATQSSNVFASSSSSETRVRPIITNVCTFSPSELNNCSDGSRQRITW